MFKIFLHFQSSRPHLHEEECFTQCSFFLLACVRNVCRFYVQTAPWASVCRSKITICFGFSLKFDLQREWLKHYGGARLLGRAGRWQNTAAAPEQIPPATCNWTEGQMRIGLLLNTDFLNFRSVLLLHRNASHLFVLNMVALAYAQFTFAFTSLVTVVFCFVCGRR